MTNPDGPVRVLHVLQRMEAGGTQALLMNLYRNIDRSRLQFDFLVEYRERQFYDDEIESLGGRIYRASFREDLNPFRFYSYLRRFFEEHREYRIVHVHAYTIGYLPLRAARRAGVVVRVAHSHSNRMSGHAVAVKKVMRALFPLNANRFMACSEEAGRFLFGDRGFTVVPNAIDAASFAYDPAARAEARAELGFSDDEFVVGSVGRLHHQKNQGFLLEVFAEILKARPGARLLLVGDGPERDALILALRGPRHRDRRGPGLGAAHVRVRGGGGGGGGVPAVPTPRPRRRPGRMGAGGALRARCGPCQPRR